MQQSTKAALLSGLIFPGIGQITTGRKTRGWLFVSFTVVILYLVISELILKAYSVIETRQKKGIAIDAESVSKATSDLIGFSDNLYLNTLLIIFIITWFYSVVDAYYLPKK